MGAQVCQEEQHIDKELDPKVAARRNELFKKYVTPFYNMIYKLCIKYSYSPQNVEENYTEVLVNFFRRIETYDPNRPIRTWLHICTKRHVFALERKRLAQDIPVCDDNGIETFSDEILYDDEIRGNVMGIDNYRELYSDEILSVLDEMKPIHRDAFLLQEAGYSLKEIVEIEHRKGTLKSKNIETVKSRLFLARQYLKKHLTRDGKRISCEADDEDIYSDCC
jgi:RNA polymerase sigma factor (sigma-70 family)